MGGKHPHICSLCCSFIVPQDYDLLNKLDERVSKKNTMGRNAAGALRKTSADQILRPMLCLKAISRTWIASEFKPLCCFMNTSKFHSKSNHLLYPNPFNYPQLADFCNFPHTFHKKVEQLPRRLAKECECTQSGQPNGGFSRSAGTISRFHVIQRGD